MRSRGELAELAAAFNDMAAQLEDLFDARRQLVAWASHDLRTPIASIQAMLEALEDGLAEPERYLPAMREQIRTLGLLVDDLFELARIDAGGLLVVGPESAGADHGPAAPHEVVDPLDEERRADRGEHADQDREDLDRRARDHLLLEILLLGLPLELQLLVALDRLDVPLRSVRIGCPHEDRREAQRHG